MLHRLLAPCVLLPALLMGGCLSNPVSKSDYAEYKSAPIGDAETLPGESALKGERTKVIVLNAEEGSDPLIRNTKVGTTLTHSVAGVLGSGTVEIVDNNLDPKLAEALRIAESKGATGYNGPKLADFAIKVVVNSATYGAPYQKESSYFDKKAKKQVIVSAAGYYHAAAVAATVRIYELPSLKLVNTVKVEAKSSQFDPTRGADSGTGTLLITKAAAEAPVNQRNNLLSEFASKGYVSARKSNGTKNIFFTTLGLTQGVKPGDAVQIYDVRRAEHTDLKGGEADEEEVLVADGTVTENITGKGSWIYVSDEQKAKVIRRGNVVKSHHKDGILDAVTKNLPVPF